jgi:hypothetical protein
MPWEHCGRTINDDQPCPSCGVEKPIHTIQFDQTRLFQIGLKKWKGDAEAQAATLVAAQERAAPFCET